MKPNVGGLDRTFRIVIGLGLLASGLYFKSWWGLLGLGPLTTAFIRFCPAYLPFGISSCRTAPKSQP